MGTKFDLERSLYPPEPDDWFSLKLFRLIRKADVINREKLRLGFPNEVAMHEAWEKGRLDEWEAPS